MYAEEHTLQINPFSYKQGKYLLAIFHLVCKHAKWLISFNNITVIIIEMLWLSFKKHAYKFG